MRIQPVLPSRRREDAPHAPEAVLDRAQAPPEFLCDRLLVLSSCNTAGNLVEVRFRVSGPGDHRAGGEYQREIARESTPEDRT